MKKYNVEFGSGEALNEVAVNGSGHTVSYRPYEYCDYMLVDVENSDGDTIRLYAQVNPNKYGFDDYDNGKSDKWDEYGEYCDLKEMIIGQAKDNSVNPACLHFFYD